MVLYCARGTWIVLSCLNGCWKYIQAKCPVSRMCDNCSISRRATILARLYSSYDLNPKSIKTIVLWTIGTDLKSDVESRKKLAIFWKYFRARMNKNAKWSPLFRVVEAGSRGGRLHIHFLNNGYLSHKFVIKAWREVTRSNANVNFSNKAMSPKYAIRYAAKYLTKDMSKFTFLGAWYGRQENNYDPGYCKHGDTLIYYNTMVDKTGIVGQSSIEDH